MCMCMCVTKIDWIILYSLFCEYPFLCLQVQRQILNLLGNPTQHNYSAPLWGAINSSAWWDGHLSLPPSSLPVSYTFPIFFLRKNTLITCQLQFPHLFPKKNPISLKWATMSTPYVATNESGTAGAETPPREQKIMPHFLLEDHSQSF